MIDLHDVGWYGLSFRERARYMQPDHGSSAQPWPQEVETRVREWRRKAFFDDTDETDVLHARLAAEGISHQLFCSILAGSPPARLPETPPWVTTLERALGPIQPSRCTMSADAKTLPTKILSAQTPPFLRAFEPFLSLARVRLRELYLRLQESYGAQWLKMPSMEDDLLWQLASVLSTQAARTLALELNVARIQGRLDGRNREERYHDFVERLCLQDLPAVLSEYRVLARILTITLDNWMTSTTEMLKRIAQDYDDVALHFSPEEDLGQLIQASSGWSDPHRGFRTVWKLHFASGSQIVYKPRSLTADARFQELLEWLNDTGASPALRPLRLIERPGYGWEEFIPHTECHLESEIQDFYRRQGAYVMLFYLLRGVDFHMENVIAFGDQPMYVDLETIFHHTDPGQEEVTAATLARRAVDKSVLGLAILPMWVSGPEGTAEMGGLAGHGGQPAPRLIPTWKDAETDEMWEARLSSETFAAENLPMIEGQFIGPEKYVDELVEGFESMYELIVRHRNWLSVEPSPLTAFSNVEVRHIVRPTSLYGRMLRDSYHPDYLRDAVDRDMLFDRLWSSVQSQPHLGEIIPAEQRDLWNNDIPIFLSRPRSRDLWDSSGEQVRNYFEQDSMSEVLTRLEQLSGEDLSYQSHLIRSSMATLMMGHRLAALPDTSRESYQVDPAKPVELIDAAIEIGLRLEALGFKTEGQVCWVGVSATPDEKWALAPVGFDMYGGLSGISLFLAYLAHVTGEQRFESLARAAIKAPHDELPQYATSASVGGFAGTASVMYVLMRLAELWGEDSLVERCLAVLPQLEVAVEDDDAFDLLAGCAGCIPVLIDLHRRTGEKAPLDLANRCGTRLLTHAKPVLGGHGWVTSAAKVCLGGFSHGAAGISYALLQLADATAEDRFYVGAQAGLTYERGLFSAKHGNWRDLRSSDEEEAAILGEQAGFRVAWCHGAPGIALGRLLSLSYDDTPLVRQEIYTALSTTERLGFGGDHSLCHGDLGNSDVLLIAGEVHKEDEWHRKAWHRASAVLRHQERSTWHTGVPGGIETPGLFLGIAGIGLQLLRLARPSSVPSVLGLQSTIRDG